MTRTRAQACSRGGCRNTTVDPGGRCHLHRGSFTDRANGIELPATPPPPRDPAAREVFLHPSKEQWTNGTIHPTGDYDTVDDSGYTVFYERDDEYHRLDGPAQIFRGGEKGITYEGWYVHDLLHRTDGPAEIHYSDGSVYAEIYYEHGEKHRLDGPADISYGWDGAAVEGTYFVHGVEYTEEDFGRLREALDTGAPLEWAIAFVKREGS